MAEQIKSFFVPSALTELQQAEKSLQTIQDEVTALAGKPIKLEFDLKGAATLKDLVSLSNQLGKVNKQLSDVTLKLAKAQDVQAAAALKVAKAEEVKTKASLNTTKAQDIEAKAWERKTKAVEQAQEKIKKSEEAAIRQSEKAATAAERDAQRKIKADDAYQKSIERDAKKNEKTLIDFYKKEEAATQKLTNDYALLSAAYNEARSKALNYAVVLGTKHQLTLQAINDAKLLRDRLAQVDDAVGMVSHSTTGYNAVGAQFNQLLRELPNAGISVKTFLISLSNNLTYFGEAIGRARKDGDSWRTILKNIGSSLFGLVGILNIAVLAITAYSDEIADFFTGAYKSVTKASDGTKIFTNQTKVLSEVFKEASTNYSKAAAEIDILKTRFFDAAATAKTKKEVIEVLNEKYGDTIGKIKGINDAEKFFIERSDAFVKSLMLRAQIEGAYNQIAKNTETILKQQATTVEDNVSTFQKVTSYLVAFSKSRNLNQKQIDDEYEKQVNASAKRNTNNVANAVETSNNIIKDFILKATKDLMDIEKLFGFGEGKDDDKNGRQRKAKQDKRWEETRDMLIAQSKEREAIAKADADNERNSLDNRLAALKKVNTERIRQIEIQTSAEAMFAAKSKEESDKIDAEKNTAIIENTIKFNAERQKLFEDYGKLLLDQEKLNASEYERIITEKYNAEILAIEYSDKTIRQKNREKRALDKQMKKELLQAQIDLLEGLKVEFLALGLSVDEIDIQINKLTASINNLRNTSKQGFISDEAVENMNNILSLTGVLVSALQELGSINDAYIKSLDYQIQAQETLKEKEIDRVQRSTLSEKEKQAEIDLINKNAEQKREEFEAKKRKAEIENAKFQKAANIAQIIQNTAAAITGALKVPIIGGALAAGYGALGALQLAKAIATPIPQFYKGTDNSPEGFALTGERGRELKITPSGDVSLTPSTTTLDYLEKGTKIIPHNETEQILRSMQYATLNGYVSTEKKNRDNKLLARTIQEGNKDIVKAIDRNGKRKNTIPVPDYRWASYYKSTFKA